MRTNVSQDPLDTFHEHQMGCISGARVREHWRQGQTSGRCREMVWRTGETDKDGRSSMTGSMKTPCGRLSPAALAEACMPPAGEEGVRYLEAGGWGGYNRCSIGHVYAPEGSKRERSDAAHR